MMETQHLTIKPRHIITNPFYIMAKPQHKTKRQDQKNKDFIRKLWLSAIDTVIHTDLHIWSGNDGIELVSTWNLSAIDKKKLSTYWTRFENYLSPKSNFRLARYKLRTLKQEPDESVDSFVEKIRILVEGCKFTSPDEHVIDAFTFGSNSKRTQTKLLEKDATLTLDTALNIARTEEGTSKQVKGISSDVSTRVDALKHCPTSKPRNASNKPSGFVIRLCGCCGTEHDISQRS